MVIAIGPRRAAHLRETDCVAGHVRLELRNVVANYPFEGSHKFVGIEPNSRHRDYSHLICALAIRSSGPVPDLGRIACALAGIAAIFCRCRDDPAAGNSPGNAAMRPKIVRI